MSTVLSESRPVARKQHVCDHCVRKIERGERYHSWSGVHEGGFGTWRTCAHCDAVVAHLWRTDADAFDPDYGLDLCAYLNDTDSPLFRDFRRGWRGVTVDQLKARLDEPDENEATT